MVRRPPPMFLRCCGYPLTAPSKPHIVVRWVGPSPQDTREVLPRIEGTRTTETPRKFSCNDSTILHIHPSSFPLAQRGIKSIPGPLLTQMHGCAGPLLEVTIPMSLVNCTDNAVRPFPPQSPKSSLFHPTHASSSYRHLNTHRSEPRFNR
jgi:hypothetical protein